MNSGNVQNMNVSVDTKVEEILECDKKGIKMIFAFERGRFQELQPEVVKELGVANRERYQMAKEMHDQQPKDAWENELQQLIHSAPKYSNATERLAVEGDPNHEYQFAAVEGIQQEMAKGWKIVEGGVKTGQNPSGKGITKTMSNGRPELILMSIPKAGHEKLMAKHHAGIEGFMNGQVSEAVTKHAKGMGGSVEPEVSTSKS